MKMFNIVVLVTVFGLGNCGLIGPIPLIDGRIVGGTNVTIEEFPYQVSLQYFGSHLCGGTILSVNKVLTAAHCTDGLYISYFSVRAGSTYHGTGGQVVNVQSILQNPVFTFPTFESDVSVLCLESSLTLGPGVQPASLAVDRPPDGTAVVVSGWGALSERGPSPLVLQAVEVKIVNQADCKNAYGSSAITESMICASAPSKDSCKSDSGGPLVLKGTRILVGVVSWGYGCARHDYPGVYASVPDLLTFIYQNM